MCPNSEAAVSEQPPPPREAIDLLCWAAKTAILWKLKVICGDSNDVCKTLCAAIAALFAMESYEKKKQPQLVLIESYGSSNEEQLVPRFAKFYHPSLVMPPLVLSTIASQQ